MGDSKYTPNPRKYYKTNFVDLVELITPEVYRSEDLILSGTEINPVSQVINSHINVAANISDIIPLSGVANSQTSALGNIGGIAQYFVKQNELTKISPFLFESKILLPLSTTLSNYDTSAEFSTYLSGTLLPMIIPPSLTQVDPLQANIATLSSLTGDSNASSVHNYLVDALGWIYFLNTSAGGGLDYSPSSYVLSALNSLYLGNTLETVDGIKGLTEYLWRNNETCAFGSYIPADFISGTVDGITESSAGVLPTYTSGTQKLDALQTLMDVVYSPLYIDEQDYTVKAAFDSYIDASLLLSNKTSKGPYRKFTNLLGYEFADLTNEIENIGLIYDIENVKEEHLQYIADLVGFKLRGNSPSKWRQQLRLAIDLYKKSGTLGGIQAAINALIVDSIFDVSGKVEALWESYIPQLLWYALGSESPLFKNLRTWTHGLSNKAGVHFYSPSSLEENIKIVVDSILLDLYRSFPDNFVFNGESFPVPQLWNLDSNGNKTERYTIINQPRMKPFHIHTIESREYLNYRAEAARSGQGKAFAAATGFGALGLGVYMAGAQHPLAGERPTYLKPEGDINFLFNYREKENYPLPPFEEFKYYRDSIVTADMVRMIVERLKCFRVKDSFADEVGSYILSSAVTDSSDLGTLNGFLMLFSSVQVAPNFNDVMLSISDYEKNLLSLWNGKSSHLFINFKDTDFDFAKNTLEGDSKYALYEASRVIREFAPAHAITKVNLTASANDYLATSSTKWEYLGFDKDDTRAGYTSASVLANFETSGAAMGLVAPGTQSGRGGLNTFRRTDVDRITDSLESTTLANITAPRRALRRRNFRYTLPKEGYYDRTGFNGPTNWNLEVQNPNLVSYSVTPTDDPGITSLTDVTGYYWLRTNDDLGTFSSVLLTNPDGGASSIILSGDPATTAPNAKESGVIQLNPKQAYGSNATNSRMPMVLADKTITWSVYVKRAPTPTVATSSCSIRFTGFDAAGITQDVKGRTSFAWESDNPTDDASSVLTLKISEDDFPTTLEDAGDGWYRISVSVAGNPWGSHQEASGIWSTLTMGDQGGDADAENVEYKVLYWYGPQVEQWETALGKTVPTTYQSIETNVPTDNNDREELTLGYVPSASEFYPILDPINPSGVWNDCENLDSSRQFSGVYTSATFPYRGLSALGSNTKMPEVDSATDRYVDRGQVPELYNTMHELYEAKAYDYANQQINLAVIPASWFYNADDYWKNNRQSFANEAIASGFVLNSFADYENFSFGIGLQKAHRDYCKYFEKHPLGLTETAKTGGNIFAQVFGKGLYNCDFDLTGSAVSTMSGNYVAASVSRTDVLPISYSDGSGVFSTCAVAEYSDGTEDLPASGTYIASGPGEAVLPLTGTYISPFNVNTAQYSYPSAYNAEFRNPNILSGIEFVQTSGGPNTNQFIIFKLDSSNAVKGQENSLVDNTVIKCKSVGGLPRLRFDLSSYGDRPNHFIKDHKFKLTVKALVAEENSTILGGGRLGVWIHTKPKYLGNKNLLFYTDDPWNSPGIPDAGTPENQWGVYWDGVIVNSFSSILETNPFGGVSSIALSGHGSPATPSYTYISAREVSSVEANGGRARGIYLKDGYNTIFSMYVKRPDSGALTPSSFYTMIHDINSPDNQTNKVDFEYLTAAGAGSGIPTIKEEYTGVIGNIEDVGNDWYRATTCVSGLGRGKKNGNTVEGDMAQIRFYLGDYDDQFSPNESLWLYAPQVEQWPIGTGPESRTTPTPYQAVAESMPVYVRPDGYMWSWTPAGKWEVINEDRLSIPGVKNSLAHAYDFGVYDAGVSGVEEDIRCLGNISESTSEEVINNNTLLNMKDRYFQNFEIEFDTRNFTIHNNSEYLDIIPMDDDVYTVTPEVNMDDTNYIVEVFFFPNNRDKYLLIDSIELQDVTQRDNTSIGTGHGVATSGIPLRPWVQEDKIYLNKDQLRDVLKFYNGLAGLGTGMYATNLASRDATITSGTLELSGGSRLNYRLSPTWGATNSANTQPNYYNFSSLEIDN